MKVNLNISDLRATEGAKADAFQDYLKEKLPKSVKINLGEPIEIEAEEGLKNATVRLLAKKFLARERLQDELRVVTLGENLAIKNRKKTRI
jgi:hypothetical protein